MFCDLCHGISHFVEGLTSCIESLGLTQAKLRKMTGVAWMTDMIVRCVSPLKKRLTEVCTQERKFHEQQGVWGGMSMEEGAIQL